MSNSSKQVIELEIPIQGSETIKENPTNVGTKSDLSIPQEMPTISTLLQRKKMSLGGADPSASVKNAASLAQPEPKLSSNLASPDLSEQVVVQPAKKRSLQNAVPQQSAPQVQVQTRRSGPPLFTGTLRVEPIDLKTFQKELKNHKKSLNMRKLDCLNYFSSRFSEVALFCTAPQDRSTFVGKLGFGSSQLVTGVPGKIIEATSLPSVFAMVMQNTVFVGDISALRAEDQRALSGLGFGAAQMIGVFPLMYKKVICGVWICIAKSMPSETVSEKEQKAVAKIFSDFPLE